MSARFRSIATILLLFLGLQLSLIVDSAYWPPRNAALVVVGMVAILCLVPAGRRPVERLLDRCRAPSVWVRGLTFFAIVAVSVIYLYVDARHQLRDFAPRYQDEYSYLLQTRMLAGGRLWRDAVPDSFESFQIVTRPVYASIYFPGAAMLYVPGVWLGLPTWAMPLVLSGLAVGMVYLVFTTLIDGVAGLLGAVMMVGLPIFRKQSIMLLAQTPVLLLILVALWAWLNWRHNRRAGWALLMGVATGWALVTRPLDGLCVALPLAIAVLWEHRAVRTLLPASLGAMPFLAVQLIFNLAVTGSTLQTPFSFYAEQSLPQTALGFHGFDPSIRPQSRLPQKQVYYDRIAVPSIRSHTPAKELRYWSSERLPQILREGAPHALLLILFPMGFLGLTGRARRLCFWVLPLFCGLYFFYSFRLPHYLLTAVPVVVLLIAIGASVLPRSARAFAALAIVSLTICQLPELTHARDDTFVSDELRDIDAKLAGIPEKSAIVLFRFASSSNPEIEPVYNVGLAALWDNRIVRAHDLGARNPEPFALLANSGRSYAVYRYDRETAELKRLGTLAELSKP